jgi:hypothetical protein
MKYSKLLSNGNIETDSRILKRIKPINNEEKLYILQLFGRKLHKQVVPNKANGISDKRKTWLKKNLGQFEYLLDIREIKKIRNFYG